MYHFLCSIVKLLWSQSYSKEVFVALMTRTDKDGNTPFHRCCKNGHTAVAQEFLAILEEDGVLECANGSVVKAHDDNSSKSTCIRTKKVLMHSCYSNRYCERKINYLLMLTFHTIYSVYI